VSGNQVTASTSTVNINGVELFYKEAGSAKPLLLVHGAGFNADFWDGVLASFARTHRTISYDRRAYQRIQGSPPPRQNYNEQHGDDLAALLLA